MLSSIKSGIIAKWKIGAMPKSIYNVIGKIYSIVYRIVGKFGGGKVGECGESSMTRQTKTIQISNYN